MLFRCNNSFIALPPPPDETLSSIEINFLLFCAISVISFSSKGLINLISITVASISLPASMAGSSILPNAKIAMSRPVLIIFAFPSSIISSVVNSSTWDLPLGKRIQTGPFNL